MNKFIAALAFLLAFSAQASGKKVTVETVITCQQEDGDQWVEVGIAMNDGPGFQALVVSHDADDGSAKLVASGQVVESKKNGRITFEDKKYQTIRLVVVKDRSRNTVGSLTVLLDGPGSFQKDGLLCYENSSISFDKK